MGRAVEGRRHLRLRPQPPAQRGLLDRHPPAHGVGLAARRARLLLHPHRPGRAVPADAGQERLLPDGLGRQRPADRAPGAELLRRAVRPLPAVRRRLHARRKSPTRSARCRSAGPTSSSCASSSCRRTRRSSRTSGGRSACRWTGTQHYTTIGPRAQKVSQRAFLRNLARGEAYLQEAPTLWDVTFQTAVAQAELEAREYAGHYYRVAFHGADGPVFIETTRPELVPSVVALIAHPDDERYQPMFGTTVTSPVFGVEIPVFAHPLPSPTRAPASRCAAPSATSPTSPGGASSSCPCAP